MLKRNSLEGLSFFQLKENYPIKPFDCEDDDLNDFLFNKALPYYIKKNCLLPLLLLKIKNVL